MVNMRGKSVGGSRGRARRGRPTRSVSPAESEEAASSTTKRPRRTTRQEQSGALEPAPGELQSSESASISKPEESVVSAEVIAEEISNKTLASALFAVLEQINDERRRSPRCGRESKTK